MNKRLLTTIVILASLTACTDETETDPEPSSPCEPTSALGLAGCVEEARYVEDLRFVAAERNPGSAHHLAVQDLCADRFAEYGFTVERHDYGTGINVIGVKEGTSDERVLVSAHYDHIPGCAGADDNATGVAGLLETARILGDANPERTLVVACWDEEEDGLIGADAYAARAAASGENLRGVFVYEMIGYRDDTPNTQELPFGFAAVFPDETAKVAENDNAGDFIAVIGDSSIQEALSTSESFAGQLDLRAVTLAVDGAVKNDPAFRDLQRSDHAPFWQRDIPALFITDTSEFRYSPYHCRNGEEDVIEHLDHAFSVATIQMTTAAVASMLGID